MKLKVKRVHVALPLFVGGKNLKEKIESVSGVSIEYDTDVKRFEVTYNGETSNVPESATSSFVFGDTAKEEFKAHVFPKGKIKAQVQSPTDHVFAEGPGKVRN